MEARGQDPTETSGALHYSDMWPYNTHISSGRVDMPCLGSLQASFHDFELIWGKCRILIALVTVGNSPMTLLGLEQRRIG